MDLNKDIYVYYSGGSGGVMLQMSLLLLLKDTHKNTNENIHTVIDNVWNIPSCNKWKDTEPYDAFYTGENKTPELPIECNSFRNVYRVCGSTDIIHKTVDTSMAIYTDVHTQFTLAELKKAHWFKDNFYGYNGYKSNGIELYNAIKDDKWPSINSINDLTLLDKKIQTELILTFGFPQDIGNPNEQIRTQKTKLSSAMYNKQEVYTQAINVNKKCNYAFLLQDIIATEFECVTNALCIQNTQEVKDHVKQWVNLHPPEIQKLLRKK